jgi:hypothetical protein
MREMMHNLGLKASARWWEVLCSALLWGEPEMTGGLEGFVCLSCGFGAMAGRFFLKC